MRFAYYNETTQELNGWYDELRTDTNEPYLEVSEDAWIQALEDTANYVDISQGVVIYKDMRTEEEIAEYNATQYQRSRASSYPPIGDQLDMMYHDAVDGTTIWKDTVSAVKDAHPKP